MGFLNMEIPLWRQIQLPVAPPVLIAGYEENLCCDMPGRK
jgi:hypothetical protein